MNDPYLLVSDLQDMIGPDSKERFNEATVGDKIDFSILFRNTLTKYLVNSWPDNPFVDYYKEFYA